MGTLLSRRSPLTCASTLIADRYAPVFPATPWETGAFSSDNVTMPHGPCPCHAAMSFSGFPLFILSAFAIGPTSKIGDRKAFEEWVGPNNLLSLSVARCVGTGHYRGGVSIFPC